MLVQRVWRELWPRWFELLPSACPLIHIKRLSLSLMMSWFSVVLSHALGLSLYPADCLWQRKITDAQWRTIKSHHATYNILCRDRYCPCFRPADTGHLLWTNLHLFLYFCMKTILLCCWFYSFYLKRQLYPVVDFHPHTITMANHNPARIALMVLGFLVFLSAITFNFLSGFGAKSGSY